MTLNEFVCMCSKGHTCLLVDVDSNVFFFFLIFGIGYRAILFFVDVIWVFFRSFFGTPGTLWVQLRWGSDMCVPFLTCCCCYVPRVRIYDVSPTSSRLSWHELNAVVAVVFFVSSMRCFCESRRRRCRSSVMTVKCDCVCVRSYQPDYILKLVFDLITPTRFCCPFCSSRNFFHQSNSMVLHLLLCVETL